MNFRTLNGKPISEIDVEHPDGPIIKDDPSLTRMANCIRYMRSHPMYMPPNPWPPAMALYGIKMLKQHFHLKMFGVMPIEEFENISLEKLFEPYPAEITHILFSPMTRMTNSEEDTNYVLDSMIKSGEEDMSRVLTYLMTNQWYVVRPKAAEPPQRG